MLNVIEEKLMLLESEATAEKLKYQEEENKRKQLCEETEIKKIEKRILDNLEKDFVSDLFGYLFKETLTKSTFITSFFARGIKEAIYVYVVKNRAYQDKLTQLDQAFLDKVRTIFIEKVSNYTPTSFPNRLFFYMTRRKTENNNYYANVDENDIDYFMSNYQKMAINYFDFAFNYGGEQKLAEGFIACLNILKHQASPVSIGDIWENSFRMERLLQLANANRTIVVTLANQIIQLKRLQDEEFSELIKQLHFLYGNRKENDYKDFYHRWMNCFASFAYLLNEQLFQSFYGKYESSILEYITFISNQTSKSALEKYKMLNSLKETLLKNETYISFRKEIKKDNMQ